MKQPLEIKKPIHYGDNAIAKWREAEPFVMNDRGVLIHRPRSVTVRNGRKGPYLSVKSLCGHPANGAGIFTFLAAPPEGRLVCHACENRALMAGLPSSSELAGRHVCVGRMKVHNTCHIHGEKEC